MKVRVRIVKSIEDPAAVEKYILGHLKVLEAYGVTKVTSTDTSWIDNPHCYLIIVENVEDGRVLGGARVQLNSLNNPLPLVDAVREIDLKIEEYMTQFQPLETAELCGLWNSKEVAGYGIGSIHLGRVGIAICSQLKLKKLLALCSPATLRNCRKIGFSIIKTLGDDGKFYYPKEGLIATALEINDLAGLPEATPIDRAYILNLREQLNWSSEESGPKGTLEIEFDLKIFDHHFA